MKRKCSICGNNLVPCQVSTKLEVEVGVLYPDNLWAIDGRCGTLTEAWGCRGTCEDPTPVEATDEAVREWNEAYEDAVFGCPGRPMRSDGRRRALQARVAWAAVKWSGVSGEDACDVEHMLMDAIQEYKEFIESRSTVSGT